MQLAGTYTAGDGRLEFAAKVWRRTAELWRYPGVHKAAESHRTDAEARIDLQQDVEP